MKIDKINDEFIVNCTNNSKEERQQVYKFLVDNRNYSRYYLTNNYPIIVCNKKEMNSNHYNTVDTQKAFPNYPIYTFEQFKKMYVNANNMKIYTIEELRNAPIQIRVYSGEQAIKLAYAAGYYTDWKPLNAKYPIYCYLDEQTHPSWNPFPFKNKLTIIEFNQIKNFMENKKIIGYKLIKPEYTKAVCAIEGYICFGENIRDGHVIFLENREEGFKKLQDAKVLDLWFEKVYEKEKQIVKMYSSNKGEFEIEIIDGKAYYRPENKELPKEFIRDIINSFDEIIICSNKKENPYNVTIASLNVGCYHNCKKEDWEKVYKLLK